MSELKKGKNKENKLFLMNFKNEKHLQMFENINLQQNKKKINRNCVYHKINGNDM